MNISASLMIRRAAELCLPEQLYNSSRDSLIS
jgi:hypothetical protein